MVRGSFLRNNEKMKFFAFAVSALLFVCCFLSPLQAETALDRVLAKTKSNIVRVVGYNDDGSRSLGSGVLIRDRFVVTAKHVLRGCSRATCEFDNGEKITAIEEIRNVDDQSVLILARKPNISTEIVVANRDPSAGETVVFAGFDHGSRLRYYDATIGIAGRFNNGSVSEANAAAISGNSGGPAFDSNGRFFGTLWGTDGRNTSLVSNASTNRFFRHVAERFPSFGGCFDATPRTRLEPVTPPIQQPKQPNREIERLQREIEALKIKTSPETWFEQNKHRFRFQIVLRDREGNEIDRDTVDAIGGEINLQFFEIE